MGWSQRKKPRGIWQTRSIRLVTVRLLPPGSDGGKLLFVKGVGQPMKAASVLDRPREWDAGKL